jgi:hypothetical protein
MTLFPNAFRLMAGASVLALATFGFIARDGHAPRAPLSDSTGDKR